MQGIYYLAEKGSYVDPYGDNIWQRFVEGVTRRQCLTPDG